VKSNRLPLIAAFCGLITLADAGGAACASRSFSLSALDAIAPIAAWEIRAGRIPGAVVVIGHNGSVVYRRAFGDRALRPSRVPMTIDTIFDLASVTKAVATATAIMQLAERGKLRLDAPAAWYWPAFGAHGKRAITIRDLLTHYSGLPPDLDTTARWSGYRAAMRRIAAMRPV
jgi:CubicO group peptidase (beta-lactamase class C family)